MSKATTSWQEVISSSSILQTISFLHHLPWPLPCFARLTLFAKSAPQGLCTEGFDSSTDGFCPKALRKSDLHLCLALYTVQYPPAATTTTTTTTATHHAMRVCPMLSHVAPLQMPLSRRSCRWHHHAQSARHALFLKLVRRLRRCVKMYNVAVGECVICHWLPMR